MKHVFDGKTILFALLFGVVYALVVGITVQWAVGIWGRPGGVAFGILVHYVWLGHVIFGFAMVFIFRTIRLRYALLTCLAIITIPTFLLLPTTGERPYLSMYCAAVLLCLCLAAWEYWRGRNSAA